ncbi:hypothetical protein AX17_007557 [Amanita inopinata Kibby_2008]|nr:hypothetical protein AX17_007557 [Amanita inopinata Kibby_2008]
MKALQRQVQISKTISWLLRHSQELPMRKDGYVCVLDLLRNPRLHGMDFLTLEDIVRRDKKQRYHLLYEPHEVDNPGLPAWWIRANQGHSLSNIKVDLKRLLEPNEIPMAVHGTTLETWKSIAKQGILCMERNYIHLAQGVPGTNVTSGMRDSCQILIYINVAKAMRDGIKFYLSSNGVVLTDGNAYGILKPCYFQKVERVDVKIREVAKAAKGTA